MGRPPVKRVRWTASLVETKFLGPVVGYHLTTRGLENGCLQRAFCYHQRLCHHIAQRHLLLHCSLLSGGRARVEGTVHVLSSVDRWTHRWLPDHASHLVEGIVRHDLISTRSSSHDFWWAKCCVKLDTRVVARCGAPVDTPMAPLLRELSPALFSGTLGFSLKFSGLSQSSGVVTSSIDDAAMHWSRFDLSLLPLSLLRCSKLQ